MILQNNILGLAWFTKMFAPSCYSEAVEGGGGGGLITPINLFRKLLIIHDDVVR